MRVIPVIDLKGGNVVHAVAGDRSRYQPVRSVLAPDARPTTIASAFRETGVFDRVYVADLDAISGAQPDWDALQQIAATGLKIWLDAGVNSIDRLRLLSAFDEAFVPLESIIVGLESLPDESTLRACVEQLGPSRCIFSLDLRNGEPLTKHAPWQGLSATEIATMVIELGAQRMILLDLATVGTARGPQSLELCRRLQSDYPHLELIGGGGVRTAEDLQPLAQAGFTAVLLATALHNGTIRPGDLAMMP